MGSKAVTVYSPEESAKRLGGITVPQLIAILKAKGYQFTELMPGSKPWGRGRKVWGMTDDQITELVEGQSRVHPRPVSTDEEGHAVPAGLSAMGWDGVTRLKKIKSRVSRKSAR
jgi:hypothetical protein